MCMTGTSMTFSAQYDGNVTTAPTAGIGMTAAFNPWSIRATSVGAFERSVEVINANLLNQEIGDYAKKCFATVIDHNPIEIGYEMAQIIEEAALALIGPRHPTGISTLGVLTITYQIVDPTNTTAATLVGHGAFVNDSLPAWGPDGNERGEATIQWQFDGWTSSAKTANGPVWTPESA